MNIQILNFIKHRSHQQGDTGTAYQAGNEEEENCTVINQAVPEISLEDSLHTKSMAMGYIFIFHLLVNELRNIKN